MSEGRQILPDHSYLPWKCILSRELSVSYLTFHYEENYIAASTVKVSIEELFVLQV